MIVLIYNSFRNEYDSLDIFKCWMHFMGMSNFILMVFFYQKCILLKFDGLLVLIDED